MSDVLCLRCAQKVTVRMHAVCCDRCDKWQHRNCKTEMVELVIIAGVLYLGGGRSKMDFLFGATTGISYGEYRQMLKDQRDGRPVREWVCDKCVTGQDVTLADDGIPDDHAVNSTAVTLELPDRRLSQSPIRELLNATYVVRDNIDDFLEEPVDADPVNPVPDLSVQDEDRAHDQGLPMDTTEPVFQDRSFNISNRDFNRPALQLEESLPDGRIDVPIPDDGPVTYEVVEGGSQKGAKRLVSSEGYTYAVQRRTDNRVYWTCSVRSKNLRCPATVRQMGDFFAPGLQGHVHPADPGAGKKTKIRKQVKILAREDVFKSAAEITEQVMMEETTPDDTRMPKISLVARAANRQRQQHRPKDPTTLDFEVDEAFIGEDFYLGDVRVDDHRHLIFATRDQLRLLSTAKRWFVDGTFKLVKRPFIQLWTIHAFVRKGEDTKQVPLAYVLMSRRSKDDYVQVLTTLLGHMDTPPMFDWTMMDFEAAFREVFQGRAIKGCVFHWNQRVYRKIGAVGLATAYVEKGAIHQFLRKVMSLPYLPAEHIQPAYQRLLEQAEEAGDPVLQVMTYVGSTWVDGRVWRPENWSVFRQTLRTNNDVEGWHRRINGKGGRPDLPFYVLTPLLRREAATVDLQVRLVSEELLTRTHRRKYASLHARLFDAWDKYEDDDMTTTTLLKRTCSHIAGLGPTSSRDPIHDEDAF